MPSAIPITSSTPPPSPTGFPGAAPGLIVIVIPRQFLNNDRPERNHPCNQSFYSLSLLWPSPPCRFSPANKALPPQILPPHKSISSYERCSKRNDNTNCASGRTLPPTPAISATTTG